jgi:hypothetical protein
MIETAQNLIKLGFKLYTHCMSNFSAIVHRREV